MSRHNRMVNDQIKSSLACLKNAASAGVENDKVKITIDEFTSLQNELNEFFMKIFQSQNDQ